MKNLSRRNVLAAPFILTPLAIREAQAQARWQVATGYPDGNFHTRNIRSFLDEVKAQTGIDAQLHSNGSLLPMPQIKRGVQQGQVQLGEILLTASYRKTESDIEGGFAGVFGRIAEAYFQRHGDQSDALATIAAKNHKNGVDNPWAQMRKDFGYDFCRNESEKNPYVARPLKRTDCSLVSDGAAALVLADADTAKSMGKAVRFRAAVQVNEYLPIAARDIIRFDGARTAWQRAYEQAGVGVGDLSFVETHDCFTIAELIEYEAMGLAAEGKGGRAALEGWTSAGGKLPVNRSGGLKAKGHPIGATGVSMHVLAAMQLCGQAGAMQLPRADLAGVFNMGGAAVANYVSILERAS